MGDVLQDVVSWIEQLPAVWAYSAILVIAYGENVLPPIPGDMVVVFGGYLVAAGTLAFVPVVLLATIGGALGFMTMYLVGFYVGEPILKKIPWVSMREVDRSRRWLRRWGYGLVAANRFLSGLRSVISLTVGMGHLPAGYTAVFATLSALVWTSIIAYAGFAVGDNWELVARYLRDYGRIVLIMLFLVGAVQLTRWYLKRKGSKSGPED